MGTPGRVWLTHGTGHGHSRRLRHVTALWRHQSPPLQWCCIVQRCLVVVDPNFLFQFITWGGQRASSVYSRCSARSPHSGSALGGRWFVLPVLVLYPSTALHTISSLPLNLLDYSCSLIIRKYNCVFLSKKLGILRFYANNKLFQ